MASVPRWRVRLSVAVVAFGLASCGGEGSPSSAPGPTATQPAPTLNALDLPADAPGPGPTSGPSPTVETTGPTGPGTTPTLAPPSGGDPPPSTAPPVTTAARSSVEGDFSLTYPSGWGPAGPVISSAFAAGADCASALVVDRALPDASGPGAQVLQSFVQLCWKGTEGLSLDGYMAATYGGTGGFQAATLAGRPALVAASGGSSTYFVDTSSRRYQVRTAVTASPELEAQRRAEVAQVLASLALPD